MPKVMFDWDWNWSDRLERISPKGCLWPEDAWEKAQRHSMRALRLLDDDTLEPSILVLMPPEVVGLRFNTAGCARGRRGDWEIVFEGPGGTRDRLSDAIAEARQLAVDRFVEDRSAAYQVQRDLAIKQVLTTTGSGPRRLRGARRDEMSRTFLPELKLRNGRYEVVFNRG